MEFQPATCTFAADFKGVISYRILIKGNINLKL
jgi:hypothetical protein